VQVEAGKPKPAPVPGGLFAEPQESKAARADAKYELIDTSKKLEAFAKKLTQQDAFAFDTETTGLDTMRADLVGLSFSWKAGTGYYLPVKAPLGQKALDIDDVRKSIAPVLADPILMTSAKVSPQYWLIPNYSKLHRISSTIISSWKMLACL
jgi:DNA polymerase I-like protein with 3'-5' exonuclease and polymerase domains